VQKTVLQTIKYNGMLSPGDSVIVGLSGGADSVALLYVLMQLQAELNVAAIFAVHINHGLRESAAVNDENFVCDLCGKIQIPLKIYQADVRGLAEKERISIEEAGRKLRYFYFEEARNAFGAANVKIATGHHQNDNAETVIMNLARGAGLRGLCGIPPINGKIIRPLLDVSREEIEKYIEDNSLKYTTDVTNLSYEYTRNRIRHDVLPAIERAVNPGVVQTVAKNAAWLRADEEYLEAAAQQAFDSLIISSGDCESPLQVSLNSIALAALHPAISRRVVRIAIACVRSSGGHLFNITASHVQAVLDLAQMTSGKEVHLPGLVAYKEYSGIVITTAAPPKEFGEYALPVPTVADIPEINKIISVSNAIPDKLQPPNPKKPILYCTKAFEYGIVRGTLVLRSRRPGDKIVLKAQRPFTKKLQDYFTDAKIPRHKRDTIPILACGNEVLWVMDEKNPVSAKYSPTESIINPIWVSLWSEADD